MSRETLELLVESCEFALDVWRFVELPRQYAQAVEAVAVALLDLDLDLDEEIFVPSDYDSDNEGGLKEAYRAPWWT